MVSRALVVSNVEHLSMLANLQGLRWWIIVGYGLASLLWWPVDTVAIVGGVYSCLYGGCQHHLVAETNP
jgi:hypothetical protein